MVFFGAHPHLTSPVEGEGRVRINATWLNIAYSHIPRDCFVATLLAMTLRFVGSSTIPPERYVFYFCIHGLSGNSRRIDKP